MIISITCFFYFITIKIFGKQMFVDSFRYTAGIKQMRPFNVRILLPALLKNNLTLWQAVTGLSVILIPYLTQIYLQTLGLNFWQSFYGGLLVLGLGGIFRMNVLGYVLVDAPAIALSLLSAIFFIQGDYLPGFAILVIASLIKESSPIWVVLFSMSFIPLAGLVVPVIVYFLNPPASEDSLRYSQPYRNFLQSLNKNLTTEGLLLKLRDNELILTKPLKGSLHFNKNWFRPELVLGWGVCLGALLYTGWGWEWVLASAVIGYLQLFIATDAIRLLEYSFPLVIFAAVQVLPMDLMPLLLAVHLFNPYNEYIL